MDTEQNARRVAAISNAYRSRAQAVAAGADREKEREAAEEKATNKRRVEADEKTVEAEDLPKESWKKDDIIDWLIDNQAIDSADDVDGLTKAELIENFTYAG